MSSPELKPFTEQLENSRLTDLYALHVMDSAPETRFDRITALVADVFDVPLCFITFIDTHRQWIKSTFGGVAGETPLGDSFCRYELDQDLLLIPDTREDPRFAHTAAVTGPMAVRFYAGAALYSGGGRPLGRLCILGQSPRVLTRAEQWKLKRFAELVNQELYFDERLGEAREALSSAALHDPVTGLPGKLVSEERLALALEKNREEDLFVAVATVHFRRYDELQGIYGSQWVDQVACLMASRLHRMAGELGYVGRPAADRMVVVAGGFDREESARDWCQRVYRGLTTPFEVPDGKRTATVAVGASIAPMDGRSADELLDHANLAGNACQSHGLSFYSGDRSGFIRKRDKLIDRLTEALEEGRVELAFQPVFHHDGTLYTCEALARWHDEQLGQVSPAEFIPVAEGDPRLSRLLSCLVLRQACEAAMAWNRQRQVPVPVNVNIAGPEFMQQDFPEVVESILKDTGLPHHLLVLELTEQTVVSDVTAVIRTISQLREQGVRCALDDFGTGYSSLSYLRTIPFDSLKIDRSFVEYILEDQTAMEVARGIVNIGKALGMTLVAEGVETGEQQQLLIDVGCDALQGFYLARPMPFTDVLELLTP